MAGKNDFAEALVRLRKEREMTQKDLAMKLNVSDKAVSRWETGKNYPDIETLQRAAEVLGVGVNDLLTGDLRLTKKKSPYKRVTLIVIIAAALVYMFPVYHLFRVAGDNYFGAEESMCLLFRGWPSQRLEVSDIVDTAEAAFSEIGLSREEAKEKYGELGRYVITSEDEDVVKEKHRLKVWSVSLDRYTSESLGYMWVCYDQEGYDKNGEVSTGSWEVPALWCLEKDEDGKWYVSSIKERP